MPHLFRRLSGCVALGLGCLATRPAAAQDSTLTRLIGQNQYSLQVSGRQFSGAGWEKIRADVQKSQFVLVGEDHGTAQIPVFTAAVAREFKPALYALEVDPYVAANLTRFAAQPGQPTAYLRQYPGALCFATLAEEFELARLLRAQQARLVGLDQIFITNAAPTYHQLAEQVQGKAARAYFARRAAAYQAQGLAGVRAEHPSFVLVEQTMAAIDSLLALTKTESPAVRQLAQDYAASYRIYTSGSHQARINLMKGNLLRELRPYQTATGPAAPKMLFKFGAYHLARSGSAVAGDEVYDLGNLVQNLADVQGQKSLHLLVLGKQGAKVSGLGLLLAGRQPETYTDEIFNAKSALPVKQFMDQLRGPDWAVFDLRPLRQAFSEDQLQVPDRELQRVITGYDYLVVIPETTASKPM